MASKGMRVLVMLGSAREGRNGDRVAKYVVNSLKNKGHNVHVADPLKLDIPLLRNPIHFYPDPSKVPANVVELAKEVQEADAYVLVTPEYNRNLPPALLNLLNHAPPRSYAFKTSGIVSYSMGPGGGGNVQACARGFMTEMGALPIPFMMSIGVVHEAIDSEGKPNDKGLDGKLARFVEQFEWFAEALNKQRESKTPPGQGPMVSA